MNFNFSIELIVLFTQRAWQAGAGLITLWLLLTRLDPQEIGFYYSFLSLVGFSTFIDFGLSTVLLHKFARYFSNASLTECGRIEGLRVHDLVTLFVTASRCYSAISLFFFLLLVTFGVLFFRATPGFDSHDLVLTWIALCGVVAATLLLIPVFCLVEASGRITEVYLIRILQGVVGSLICWLILLSDGGLWAVICAPTGALIVGSTWVIKRYKKILQLRKNNPTTNNSGLRQTWAFQWRIGLGMICAYAQIQLVSPIILKTKGPIIAGQMGMSLAIVNMIVLITQPWLVRKVPELTRAAAEKRYGYMDRLFFQNLKASAASYLILALFVLLFIFSIQTIVPISKVLNPFDFTLLVMCFLFSILSGSFVIYIRSFGLEPFVLLTLISSVLVTIIGYFATSYYSVRGYLSVLLFLNAAVVFPVSCYRWIAYRRELVKTYNE